MREEKVKGTGGYTIYNRLEGTKIDVSHEMPSDLEKGQLIIYELTAYSKAFFTVWNYFSERDCSAFVISEKSTLPSGGFKHRFVVKGTKLSDMEKMVDSLKKKFEVVEE